MKRPQGRLKPKLRLVGLVVSAACAAAAIYSFRIDQRVERGWWLLGAAFLFALLWQSGLPLGGTPVPAPPAPTSRRRVVVGSLLTLLGVALWVWAPYGMYRDWNRSFDRSSIAWLIGTVLLGSGLDLLWGRWRRPPTAGRSRHLRLALVLGGLLAVSAVYRLGNVGSFPGEGYSTQIEDVMAGMWGKGFVDGVRSRWEFMTHILTTAAGIWLVGPTLKGMRVALGTVSALKTIPVFLWLQYTVGSFGAVVGTALLVCSRWDVIYSRIPQPNQIWPAVVFALLAWLLRRGRPSAYVWLGFVGGYLLYEYIVYRPLIVLLVAAAGVFSMRQKDVRLSLRILRPLIVVAMIASMGFPLFFNRLSGRIDYEYFDGLNRARGYKDYYNQNDSWQTAARKRLDRAASAAGLFFIHGDWNAVHNIEARPLVDPITAVLMLFGVAYGLVHLARGIFGLTAVAFLLTLAGTLVLTGNWDVGRAATTVVYPYALAGYGAAAASAVFEGAWRKGGRAVVAALFTAALCAAAYVNTSFLFAFWGSPIVRSAMHNNLALLSSWLRNNVRPGERVVLIAPGYTFIFDSNDATWLRGPVDGIAVADVEDALSNLAGNQKATLLVIFAGSTSAQLQGYFEWLIPGLHMQFVPDPDDRGGEIAYAHLPEPPPSLAGRVEQARCHGARGAYDVIGSAGEVLASATDVVPFIDHTVWPDQVKRLIQKSAPNVTGVRVRYQATIMIDTPGDYVIAAEAGATTVQVLIDQQQWNDHSPPLHLEAGPHTLEISGTFEENKNPSLRLLWKGSGTGGRLELIPIYRLAAVDASCTGAVSEDGAKPDPQARCPGGGSGSEALACEDLPEDASPSGP
jgi:hypothetical protein